jgi:hypothetical protein
MSPFRDLTGRRFGKLVVLCATNERVDAKVVYLCRCDCGTEKKLCGRNLAQGGTQSCGCSKTAGLAAKKRAELKGQR